MSQNHHVVRRPFPRLHALAFTLIELLVVIGIIAICLGIVMPSLARARESAKRAKCLSNLAALGQAIMLYGRENRGSLPNLNAANTANDPAGTNHVLVTLNRDQIRSPVIFHCPSDTDPVPARIETADYLLPNSARVSYDFYSVWWLPELAPKIAKIKDAPIAWDLDGGRPQVRLQNHGSEGGNVAFADGHVAWQPRVQWDDHNWPHPAKKHYPVKAAAAE